MEKPKNYLIEAILVTIFCCLPPGIAAIIYAAKVNSAYENGNIEEAREASQNAAKWVKYSLIAGIIFIILYFMIFVIAGVGGAFMGGY
ncbi:CD225/dispanin family protein [Leeuwenhoekiella sp. A16]|uniref:CD225/dispanin family protein n=1 Tax=unclassified Leeuwenhoekiella TaxID=2615029 RepID=UPI003A808FFA